MLHCVFLRKPHPKFHTHFWRPFCPWRPDQVEIKHTNRAALCLYHLNSWCVGSCKHRENFQFHHHRIRIFLTLLFSFSKISLSLWQKLESKPNTMVEFEIVRYRFMKVNGSGVTKINVVGKYFSTYKCKDVSIPSDYSFKLIACFESILKFRS